MEQAHQLKQTENNARPRSALREYQRIEAERIAAGQSRGLFWQMGAGKTAATLHGIADLITKGAAKRVLLVSTPTVVATAWPDEIKQWQATQSLEYTLVRGTPKRRAEILRGLPETGIIAVGFDTLHTVPEDLGFDVLVVDEASLCRNVDSRRFKSAARFAQMAKQRIILTGSPAPNRATDLFGVVALIDLGEALGRKPAAFLAEHTERYGLKKWQYRDLPNSRDKIVSKIRHLVTALRTEDVAELPEICYQTIEIDLPQSARTVYDGLEAAWFSTALDRQVHEDSILQRLQLVANGFEYGEAKETVRHHFEKVVAAKELIDRFNADGEPVMVVASYRGDVEALAHHYPQAVVLTSGNASDVVPRWNAGEIEVLVLNPRSAGHGLNLQKGGRVQIWVCGTWSAELFEQTVARIYRPGQKGNVTIFTIVARDTIDAIVTRTANRKASAQAAVMLALKERQADRQKPDLAARIKEARKAAAALHPDRGGDPEAFRHAWSIYEALAEKVK